MISGTKQIATNTEEIKLEINIYSMPFPWNQTKYKFNVIFVNIPNNLKSTNRVARSCFLNFANTIAETASIPTITAK